MLKGTILRAVFMWVVVIIIVQPILSHKDFLLDLNVKANASLLAQKAAPEGVVTPQLYQEIVDNLKAIGFKEDQIEIQFSSTIRERTEIIDVIILVERNPMFLYSFGKSNSPQYYYGRHRIMSEYIE